MKLIATSNLASANTITFSSIPTTFTDLVVLISVRSVSSPFLGLGFNGSTSSFANRQLTGDGTNAASTSRSDTFIGYISGSGDTANTFGNFAIYIPNYQGSTNKSFSVDGVGETNAQGAYQQIVAGLWSNTAPITSIELFQWSSGNFDTGTTASLYGILKGSDGTTVVS